MSRRDLDVALLVADAEPILGLPDWPAPLTSDEGREVDGFPLRRVEGTCGAHALAAADLASRLELLKVRPAAAMRTRGLQWGTRAAP